MKTCLFARVKEPEMLDRIGYYREDIEILESLGHEVVRATRWSEIPWGCDIYFTWWYGWGWLALSKSLLARKPNVMVGPIHYHDRAFGFFTRPKHEQWLIRLALRLADACVAVSKTEYEGLCALGARHPTWAYHSVALPAEVPSREAREPLVFSIGHLCDIGIARKRFDRVLRAAPLVLTKFPRARFVIAGRPGKGFEKLEKLTRDLDVSHSVEFPGAISQEARADYLRRAMVLAQPAVYEGFGLAQLEAMASGVPVVTSPAGALSEVVGDCGLFCDADRPEEIAAHVCALMGDAEQWNALSSRGRARAARLFSRQARRERLFHILGDVLKARRDRSKAYAAAQAAERSNERRS